MTLPPQDRKIEIIISTTGLNYRMSEMESL